jgi:hypothetical protein
MESLFATRSVDDIETALVRGVAPDRLLGIRDERRRQELAELIQMVERMSGDLNFFAVMLSDVARRLHLLLERV